MAMIRSDDDDRFVPIAVLFDPVGNDFEGLVAAVDRSDRVVEIVVVIRPIDVSRLDH